MLKTWRLSVRELAIQIEANTLGDLDNLKALVKAVELCREIDPSPEIGRGGTKTVEGPPAKWWALLQPFCSPSASALAHQGSYGVFRRVDAWTEIGGAHPNGGKGRYTYLAVKEVICVRQISARPSDRCIRWPPRRSCHRTDRALLSRNHLSEKNNRKSRLRERRAGRRSGASLCALNDRKSVDSSFGSTTLDWLCMGTITTRWRTMKNSDHTRFSERRFGAAC
jgi:hypothetical protein